MWALGLGPQWSSALTPPTHTWTGSSTLLLRKLRELARFILRVEEGQDLSTVEVGEGREGGQVGAGEES